MDILNKKISGIVVGILLSILTLWLIGFFGPFHALYLADYVIFGLVSAFWVLPILLPILCFVTYKIYKSTFFKYMFVGSLLAPIYSLGFLLILEKFAVS